MSKNTNLSFLTDFLTADIVNSRVGMNNASPQSTFDVTGTGKFSGILTLGSTVSNGTYTYTLPSATGTLALTSDIPVVTGYVPYTGATTSVDLGDNVLTSGGLNIDSLGGYGGALNLRQATSFSLWTGAPYTSIYATTGNRVVFMFSNDNRTFTLDGSLVSAASPRTFTFPDATGTFALTSQIPTNAVGGTGTLNTIPKFTAATTIGNSNIFDSGSIIYNTNPAAGQFAWQFNGSTITGQSYGAQVIAGTNASDIGFKVMNAAASINYLVVRGDGLVTLTGALNGTSAVFSSTVSATQYTATSTGGSGLRVYGSSGTNQWDIYLNSTNLRFSDNTGTGSIVFDRPLSGTSASFKVNADRNLAIKYDTNITISGQADSGGPESLRIYADTFRIYTATTAVGLTERFTIANTGAATFSSTIAASGRISTSHSTSGDYAAVFYNSSATGEGVTVRGGSTASHNAFIVQPYNGATTLFNILATGAATFSSTITTTGANINGDVLITNSSNAQIGLNTTGVLNSVGAYLYFNRSGSNKWTAGMGPYTGSNNYEIVTGSVVALSLAVTTGAATFSSSVTTKGTGNYNGFIADNSSSSTIGGGYYAAYSFGIQRGIFGVAGTISGTTDNNIGIFAEGGLGIKFFVNGSATASHMMTSGGNVLIGTTTDSGLGKLQVNGRIYGDGFRSSSQVLGFFKNSTGSFDWEIGSDSFVGTGMYMYNGTNGYVFRLTAAGVLTTSGGGTSDRRTKEDINPINESVLPFINELNPVSFKFINDVNKKTRRGFIAQEVLETSIPSLVLGDGEKEGGIYGLDYDGILALAIKAIQEQQQQIEELKNKLS